MDDVEKLEKHGLKNPSRIERLIEEAIEMYNLNLDGLTVYTEVGSKNFVVTPIIAAMAGADVIAITRTSEYGDRAVNRELLYDFARFCDVEDKIKVVFKRDKEEINKADIITNLGFVRPIDKELIDMMNDKAVIPYMCESWEFREEDFDLQACREKGIVVMATDEDDTFDFCGALCIKMLFEEEIEVMDSKIAVLSNDAFGYVIAKYIEKLGGNAHIFKKLSDLIDLTDEYDALVIADHKLENIAFDPFGRIPVITFASNFKMERTLADLGPKPIIDLHCAGLRVGEVMAKARLKGYTVEYTEKMALHNSPAQILE